MRKSARLILTFIFLQAECRRIAWTGANYEMEQPGPQTCDQGIRRPFYNKILNAQEYVRTEFSREGVNLSSWRCIKISLNAGQLRKKCEKILRSTHVLLMTTKRTDSTPYRFH